MRYGLFEIRTSCGSCGQPVPVNGPFLEVTCASCFNKVHVPAEIFAGFLNDFEEEYDGLAEREGSGGTLMSGSGTYKYGHWRLAPRCSSCKKPLSLPDSEGTVSCQCGVKYQMYKAPEWLAGKVPSVMRCISLEAPVNDSSAEPDTALGSGSAKPVVMSCPQCSGALSISSENERIMSCQYCDSEVFIPDAVWKRLHPVKTVEGWYACFQGKTGKQLQAARRIRDIEEEKVALLSWKAKNIPELARKSGKPYYGLFIAAVLLLPAAAFVLSMLGKKSFGFTDALITALPFWIAAVALATILISLYKTLFSTSAGPGKACKEGMASLAAARGWEHKGADNKYSVGYIRETFQGRDMEITPDDDYAVEIEIHDSIFYLKTEPPGHPPEDMFRFSTGDGLFDDLFPIRYATPEFTAKIERSPELAETVLAPVYWFMGRWRKRIGRLEIDWSSAQVHITPGCFKSIGSDKNYLLPQDIEPLFEDMMTLAEGVDAVAKGKEPELPYERFEPAMSIQD